MINWKKITKENFTEFLCEHSLEEIQKHGIIFCENYHSNEQTYVFLSKEGCVLNHARVYFSHPENQVICVSRIDEHSEYDITHFALKSELNKVLPEGAAND